MYLAEDRVSAQLNISPTLVAFNSIASIDLVLGARLETRRFMASALCQISICRDRCARSGAPLELERIWRAPTLRLGSRADLAAAPLAQRLVLRRDTQHVPLLLHLPVFALGLPEVLDTC